MTFQKIVKGGNFNIIRKIILCTFDVLLGEERFSPKKIVFLSENIDEYYGHQILYAQSDISIFIFTQVDV